jgi:NCAIR mutase (PurE)-related protein
MNPNEIKKILQGLKRGKTPVSSALKKLALLPYVDLDLAKIDTHRSLRRGFPEVILALNKGVDDLARILAMMEKNGENILITKLEADKFEKLAGHFRNLLFYPRARMAVLKQETVQITGRGGILVVTAGTSDIPVAEEAYYTAVYMGNRVKKIYDVGVAGVHRILDKVTLLRKASVIIVVAGMEGALASVIGGLTSRPVIAVPTSVGYGASFKGLSALLGMLNSCSPGIAVMNIDNGFGAGYFASLINRK